MSIYKHTLSGKVAEFELTIYGSRSKEEDVLSNREVVVTYKHPFNKEPVKDCPQEGQW